MVENATWPGIPYGLCDVDTQSHCQIIHASGLMDYRVAHCTYYFTFGMAGRSRDAKARDKRHYV